MNPQTATAKAINWNNVLRVTFRFAWAVTVLALKLAFIALTFIVGLFTSGSYEDNSRQRDEDERRQREDDNYQFMLDSEYRKRRH